MVDEKNELIRSLREESNKYKSEFDRLNNEVLMRLTTLLNKPGDNSASIEDIRKLLMSVNKLDRDISQLKQNNKEIISKHDNNFYVLRDRLNKATDEMKNSKKVEQVTKEVYRPPPIKERIIRAPPVQTKIIRSPSPIVRTYREVPKTTHVEYQKKCNCTCNHRQVEAKCYSLEKCPICNVGYVNTKHDRTRISANQSTLSHYSTNSPVLQNKVFVEPSKNKIYERRMSTEPIKHSMFSNKYLVENSVEHKEEPMMSRGSVRYSVEPLHKRISHRIRNVPVENKVVREMDPYLISENIKKSQNIKGVEVRKSITRK